jgi:hypothetical protein
LELVEMWMMDDLRTKIVASVEANTESLDPAERIRFARRFSISGWIPQAILALVRREQPLSAVDMECLGYKGAAKVSQLREANRKMRAHELHNTFHLEVYNAWVPKCSCAACKWAEKTVAEPYQQPGTNLQFARRPGAHPDYGAIPPKELVEEIEGIDLNSGMI